jgi:transcriptional antiterminator
VSKKQHLYTTGISLKKIVYHACDAERRRRKNVYPIMWRKLKMQSHQNYPNVA